MIAGMGVDIVPIARFGEVEDRPGFLGQVLTEDELRRVPPGTGRDEYCALIFATKEAVLKALGCGLTSGARWHDIAVADGPDIRLSGNLRRLAEKQSVSKIHVSHSSSATHAVAFVLFETNTPEVTQ